MPRNSSGTYTLPESAFVSGAVIRSSPVNNDLSDIASALTQSLASTGVTAMTGPIKAASGSISAPSYTFASALGTGFYLSGTNEFAWVANGVLGATFKSDLSVTWVGNATYSGNLTVSGTLSTGATTFSATSDPILTLNNTTNDSAEHEIFRLKLGDGTGAQASRRVIGSGANDITQVRDYVGTQEITRLTSTRLAVGAASATQSIALDISGYQEFSEISTPTAPAADKLRVYAKDDGTGTTSFFVEDNAGVETDIRSGQLIAIIQDVQTTGVNGSTLTTATAANTRVLNTLLYNRNSIVSLSSNRFTVPLGTWEIEWIAPLGISAVSAMGEVPHQSFLYNQTDATETARGSSSILDKNYDGSQGQNFSKGHAVVSVSTNKAFEIRHQLGTAGGATIVMGVAASLSNEIYTQVMVRRI